MTNETNLDEMTPEEFEAFNVDLDRNLNGTSLGK